MKETLANEEGRAESEQGKGVPHTIVKEICHEASEANQKEAGMANSEIPQKTGGNKPPESLLTRASPGSVAGVIFR